MKNAHRILVSLSLAAAGTLLAQTSAPSDGPSGPHRRGPGGPGGPGRGGHPIVRVLDTDKDGEISAAELANAPASIRALDTDGDGIVTLAEIRPAHPAHGAQRPADASERPARPAPPANASAHPRPVDPVMLALDANGDGALSAAEIANATTSLSALDANKDGKLTRDELRPLPPRE